MRILTIVGARPQFIKAAAFSARCAKRDDVEEIIVTTGQHFDHEMAKVFFEDLSIPEPKYDLGIHSLSHGAMVGRMLEKLETIIADEAPDAVLLYGDTNSTLAAAIAAAKMFIPIAHVEAGVRTFLENPEEINRKLTDHVSSQLFCSTQQAADFLAAEGITDGVHVTGDIMYDTYLLIEQLLEQRTQIAGIDNIAAEKPYVAVTLHRDENTRDAAHFRSLLDYIREQSDGRAMLFPIHPRARKFCEKHDIDLSDFTLLPPLGYVDMQVLLKHADILFTDSGGLQKEAYFQRIPCVTMFGLSPWPETVENGWNRLYETPEYEPRREFDEYGDGTAGEQVLQSLLQHYG